MNAQPQIILYRGKSFDDPDYDLLLDRFAHLQPAEMGRWRAVEKRLFETRAGLGAYPDQELRTFATDFIRPMLVDEAGGLGPDIAWGVLRGRVLQALIAENPALHPAPGEILLTEPRSCADAELRVIAEHFAREEPELWQDWARIEREANFENDPLHAVSMTFHRFLQKHYWAQGNVARIDAFMEVRGLVFHLVPQRPPVRAAAG